MDIYFFVFYSATKKKDFIRSMNLNKILTSIFVL